MASCGTDRSIFVYDLRTKKGVVASILEAHSYAVNSVGWGPRRSVNSHLLVSASFGNEMKLWDFRQLGIAPLQTLSGHTGTAWGTPNSRSRLIYHPTFLRQTPIQNRTAVLCSPGPGSAAVSLFHVDLGKESKPGTLASRGIVFGPDIGIGAVEAHFPLVGVAAYGKGKGGCPIAVLEG